MSARFRMATYTPDFETKGSREKLKKQFISRFPGHDSAIHYLAGSGRRVAQNDEDSGHECRPVCPTSTSPALTL